MTPLPVIFPGYFSNKSSVRGSLERGGTVISIKNYSSKSIDSVDVGIEKLICVQLRHAPKYLFGFCYVPPADSRYYSHDYFSSVQEKLKTCEMCKEYCIIGDMKARFGQYVRSLLVQGDRILE